MTDPTWSEPLAVPTNAQVAAATGETHPDVQVLEPLDFTSVGVLEIDMHTERVWVNVDGVTMLRAYRIRNMVVHDHRVTPITTQHPSDSDVFGIDGEKARAALDAAVLDGAITEIERHAVLAVFESMGVKMPFTNENAVDGTV